MSQKIVALDIGGTYVKHAVFDTHAPIARGLGQFTINENGAPEEIFNALYTYLDAQSADIVCVSMPGPTHYPSGESRMKHKFKNLYGIPMKPRFEARYARTRFVFVHDGVAFLAGVMSTGEAHGARSLLGIMLGTGLGCAFAENGHILVNDMDTPSFPMWNARFRNGAAEDYVSGRAINAAYQSITGENVSVEQIAHRARAGDQNAIKVFADAGGALGELIDDRARRLLIDRVVLGGQISKSADLILPYARAHTQIDIIPTSHPDDAALYGARALAQNGADIVSRAYETRIKYGRGYENMHIDSALNIVESTPEHTRAHVAPDAQARIVKTALENPIASPRLSELAQGKQRVLLITSDHTRPVPSHITLPLLLDEIRVGSPNAEILILIATGMHRASTPDEIRAKFGAQIADNERIENHDCRDEKHMIHMGELPSGGALKLNDRLNWAELVVAEGFIEPHFFAGFSGGRKSILPGIASEETVRFNHNSRFIANPRARQGVLEGNPIHADMLVAAQRAGLKFILNVLIDADKNIISAVAGDSERAHKAGCDMCLSMTRVNKREADVVITSNGGYPLDQNIYQAVKGMTAAEACVRAGGAIVMLSECIDGVGGEGFYNMLARAQTPENLIQQALSTPPEQTPADQWEAQILARVLSRARVYMVAHQKNREAIENMHMHYAASLDEAVRRALAHTNGGTITIIPDGVAAIVREQP